MEFQVLTHLFFFAYFSGSGNKSSGSSSSNRRRILGKAGGPQTRDVTGLAIDGKTGKFRQEISVFTEAGPQRRKTCSVSVNIHEFIVLIWNARFQQLVATSLMPTGGCQQNAHRTARMSSVHALRVDNRVTAPFGGSRSASPVSVSENSVPSSWTHSCCALPESATNNRSPPSSSTYYISNRVCCPSNGLRTSPNSQDGMADGLNHAPLDSSVDPSVHGEGTHFLRRIRLKTVHSGRVAMVVCSCGGLCGRRLR